LDADVLFRAAISCSQLDDGGGEEEKKLKEKKRQVSAIDASKKG